MSNAHKCMNLLAYSIATIICASAVAAGADGRQSPAAKPDAGIETVTVYGRRLEPMTRVAATVTVIVQREMQRTLAGDVKQMVRYEPGLSVRSDPFRFGLDTFAVRGVGGNRVAVEVDGIPAAGGFSIGSFSDSGRSFVDLALLQRVEILRGPASSLYGSDAIGGVVAMTTLTPQTLLLPNENVGLRSEAGFSGNDDGWHAAAIAAGRTDTKSVLLGYVHREGNEPDTAANVRPDPRRYTSDAALAKLEFIEAPGGPLVLTAQGGRLSQQADVNAFEKLIGSRFVNTTLLHGDDSGSNYRLSIDQRLADTDGFDTLDWRLYGQGTDTRQDTSEQRNAVPPRTPPLWIEREFRLQDRTFGAEATAYKELVFGRVTHGVVYGFELAHTQLEERRTGTQTDLNTGATTNIILGENFPVRDFPITDLTKAGVFAQDQIDIADTRWTLIPAVRADYYRLEPDADQLYREDNPNVPVVELDDTSVAPKLGLTYALSDSAIAFFQYARGFRSPPPEDVNIGLELPLFNVRAVPNPDLKPETSDGYELGVRWNGSTLRIAVSGYYNDYRDFIESKVNLGPDPATGVILFQSQNIAKARIYGTELSATARLGEWSPLLEGWTTRLSASWSRGEDLTRHEPLNSVDPPTGVFGLGYEAPSGTWGGELITTATHAKDNIDRSRVNLYGTAGYTTIDLLAHVEFSRGFWLDAGLFNLADHAYIEWSDVRGRPVGDPLIPYYTRPGRNVSATLHWRY